MRHGTIVLPIDHAREFVELLGTHAKVQLEDMNSRSTQRPYKRYTQRVDEMERILRFLTEELKTVLGEEVVRCDVNGFLKVVDEYKLDEVEARLKQLYRDFVDFKERTVKLTEARNATLEEVCVVETAKALVANDDRPVSSDGAGPAQKSVFNTIAGVVPQTSEDRFARTLFRATRGNAVIRFHEILTPIWDPTKTEDVRKSVFVIYFQDHCYDTASRSAMNQKIMQICVSYDVHTYQWPASREAAEKLHFSLHAKSVDLESLLKAHVGFVRNEAHVLLRPERPGGGSPLEEWRLFCTKEKSLYAALNLFEPRMNLRASCWYPAAEEGRIHSLFSNHQHGKFSAMLVPDRTLPERSPPTYIQRNEFTGVFQELVDTYGIPRYGEANPALVTIVTFPFFFGVMYGDIGHGMMLLVVGSLLIWRADDIRVSMPVFHTSRYILFMMGFFATYVGFLYNDFFSLGLDLFDSRWAAPATQVNKSGDVVLYEPLFDSANEGGPGPYPFGVDPAWHGAQNDLIYMNSLKMKLSVILGVLHMLAGLFMQFLNTLHEGSIVDFVSECVPKTVFMLCVFGFMDCMILHKWVTQLADPPSIINSMIAMAMWTEDTNPMFGTSLPRWLMAVSMLTVPLLLAMKPIMRVAQHAMTVPRAPVRQRPQQGTASGLQMGARFLSERSTDDAEAPGNGLIGDAHGSSAKQLDLSEMLIHQVIDTIEYVLGTVSHTASYLRLWALSLAHQQLSTVFFEMTLVAGMEVSFPLNIFAISLAFACWFAITGAILLGMDVLECFLHTLRLHWVEFQSKFYKANGEPFTPYDIKKLVSPTGED